jgi:hypothetical protein
MFVEIDFPSVNQEDRPPVGTYCGELHIFASDDLVAYVYLYSHVPSKAPSICDLLVRSGSGQAWVRDFMRLEDGNWRDSDGARGPDVWSLMPEEVLGLYKVHAQPLPEFEVVA